MVVVKSQTVTPFDVIHIHAPEAGKGHDVGVEALPRDLDLFRAHYVHYVILRRVHVNVLEHGEEVVLCTPFHFPPTTEPAAALPGWNLHEVVLRIFPQHIQGGTAVPRLRLHGGSRSVCVGVCCDVLPWFPVDSHPGILN